MAKKANRSIRDYRNKAGEKSVGPDAEGSVTYSLLNDDGKTVAKAWTWTGDQMSQFGFVTKVGNVANSIFNADEPGTVQEAIAEIDEFLAGIQNGIWREPGEGRARGPKYDKDVLAGALLAELGAAAKGDVAHYRERLEDKSYYAKVRANPKVMARYMADIAAKGEAAPNADALA